jgi:hypothetical protein
MDLNRCVFCDWYAPLWDLKLRHFKDFLKLIWFSSYPNPGDTIKLVTLTPVSLHEMSPIKT